MIINKPDMDNYFHFGCLNKFASLLVKNSVAQLLMKPATISSCLVSKSLMSPREIKSYEKSVSQ